MVKLVHKTKMPVAQNALCRGIAFRQFLPHQPHTATGRRIEPTEQMQQGALARARGADDCQRLTPKHMQVHALHAEWLASGKTDRAFHDAFLRENLMPIPALRAYLMGHTLEKDTDLLWRF